MLKSHRSFALLALVLALSACRGKPFGKPPIVVPEHNMLNQPKYKAQQENDFFADKRSMRTPVKGTIPRGHLEINTIYFQGKTKNGDFVKKIPLPITMGLVHRGQDRFDVFCRPCHGGIGNGDGMIKEFGWFAPPTYHQARLRDVPDGYIFNVITNGIRTMPSYSHQIPVEDRWAIVSYVRALQLSQDASKADLHGYQIPDSVYAAYKAAQQSAQEAKAAQQKQMQQAPQQKMSEQALIALGKKLHQERTCIACHSTNGTKGVGPTWKGLYGSKVTLTNGKTVVADSAYIAKSIMQPSADIVKGFNDVMPHGLISKPENLHALIEFIKSLK